MSAAVRASTSSRSSDAFTSSPICANVARTSADTSDCACVAGVLVCVPGASIPILHYNRCLVLTRSSIILSKENSKSRRAANSGTAPHNPTQIQPQIHSGSRIPHSPRARSQLAGPLYPVTRQSADASASSAAKSATNIAVSAPYPEYLPPPKRFFPQCSNPSPCSASLAPTNALPSHSSTPQ